MVFNVKRTKTFSVNVEHIVLVIDFGAIIDDLN